MDGQGSIYQTDVANVEINKPYYHCVVTEFSLKWSIALHAQLVQILLIFYLFGATCNEKLTL